MLNGQGWTPDESVTLVDVVRWRAMHQPDQVAYRWLADGEAEELPLTYGELDRRARAVGALLQHHHARGERALLLYPPGFDYIVAFVGCLMAGVVAVPAYPPRRNRSLGRLQAIVDDARAKFVLASSRILTTLAQDSWESAGLGNVRFLTTDVDDTDPAEDWSEWSPSLDDLAFLQYTSGSTGNPKGVMVTLGNLSHNLTHIVEKFELSAETRKASWLPPYHDMGLIGGILTPLWVGGPAVNFSPADFLQRPARWLQAISRYGVTLSGGPTFAFDLCARKVDENDLASLDLSRWSCAYVGAEPVRPDVLKRFAATFAPCGFRWEAFYPVYGLAESSLFATGGDVSAPPIIRDFRKGTLAENRAVVEPTASDETVALVGCGNAFSTEEIEIVNPDTTARCPDNTIGEIWIASGSIARGYYNQPDATERDFGARLADDGRGPFLRTGDLGFFDRGELFITGRIKDLIIIRGANYYPQDLELTVEQSHPALRPGAGAVFSIDAGGEEQVVVVQELDREHRRPDVPAIAAAIREAVSEEHGVHVYEIVLIRHATILKTSSGKIQRRACRAAYLDGTLEVIGQSRVDPGRVGASDTDHPDTGKSLTGADLRALGPTEQSPAVTGYLQQLLAPLAEIAASDIRAEQPLVSYGFDSLMAVELCLQVETNLGVTITLEDLTPELTLIQLAERIISLLPAIR